MTGTPKWEKEGLVEDEGIRRLFEQREALLHRNASSPIYALMLSTSANFLIESYLRSCKIS